MSELDKQIVDAVKEGDIQGVRKLLKAGANPDSEFHVQRYQYKIDIGDITPLLVYAALFEFHEIVECLLNSGADVNAKYKTLNIYPGNEHPTADEEATALTIAALQGNIELFDLLLKHGADPDFYVNRWGGHETPLIGGIKSGNKQIVDRLLNLGVRVNIINITPLYTAINYYNFEIFKILFDNGARFHNKTQLEEARKLAKRKNRTRLQKFLNSYPEEELVINLFG